MYFFFFTGSPAFLMVASDSDVQIIDPYKPHEGLFNQLTVSPAHKVEAMDILWGLKETLFFWTDRHAKRIQRMKVPLGDTRGKRDTTTPSSNRLVRTVVSFALIFPFLLNIFTQNFLIFYYLILIILGSFAKHFILILIILMPSFT